ncbi:MAG TPA: class I SAM-dependent methyltransferase [Tepidisphaeraceae bacterium]|nr:class I SAM-dependent methyltransferase [Tepidisphaeraceae bacterium]
MTNVWDDVSLANPHAVSDKRRRVQRMFAAIAPSYDLNNRLHTLWMDQSWRRKAVKLAQLNATDRVVDVACGTGDLTLAFFNGLRRADPPGQNSIEPPRRGERGEDPEVNRSTSSVFSAPSASVRFNSSVTQVIGIDFTYEMLPIAVAKWMRTASAQVVPSQSIRFVSGDAQRLPLPDACCDVVSIAFGIRNVADPLAAAREFFRILRPGGRLAILEFSQPTNPIFRCLYNFYFKHVLPRTATWISGDKTGAYKYLPQSVKTFIGRETMMRMLADAGFQDITQKPLTFGICVCYRGFRK